MKSLRELQQTFLTGILAGDSHLMSAATQCSPTSAAIYIEGYRARLLEVLELDYPRLRQLLGTALFSKLAERYAASHLSRTRSIRWFGAAFAEFLGRPPYCYRHPWLADIARFEWALGETFDAQDAGTIEHRHLAHIAPETWPNLRLRIHPAVRTLRLSWNAVAMVTTFSEQPPLPIEQTNDVLIWRHGLAVRHKAVNADYFRALELVREDGTFGELCTMLSEMHAPTVAASRAAELLGDWLALGLLSEFTIH